MQKLGFITISVDYVTPSSESASILKFNKSTYIIHSSNHPHLLKDIKKNVIPQRKQNVIEIAKQSTNWSKGRGVNREPIPVRSAVVALHGVKKYIS